MATNIDLAGNTLYVSDIIVGATTPGSLVGSSVSTEIGSALSLTGGATFLSGITSPVGGNASTAKAITIGTGATSSVSILFGSGSPSGLTATQGSLYLNTSGSGVNSRAFINTTGVSTWTAVTTAA
jgi:hypothetical protein